MKICCFTCRFWLHLSPQANGECRRYAPITSNWPTTGMDDWCGEWAEAIDAAAAEAELALGAALAAEVKANAKLPIERGKS